MSLKNHENVVDILSKWNESFQKLRNPRSRLYRILDLDTRHPFSEELTHIFHTQVVPLYYPVPTVLIPPRVDEIKYWERKILEKWLLEKFKK